MDDSNSGSCHHFGNVARTLILLPMNRGIQEIACVSKNNIVYISCVLYSITEVELPGYKVRCDALPTEASAKPMLVALESANGMKSLAVNRL